MEKYSITIERDAHEVYSCLIDIEKMKKWLPHFKGITPEDKNAALGIGYKFTEVNSIWGIKKEYKGEVFEFELDKILGIKFLMGNKILKFKYTVIPVNEQEEKKEDERVIMVNFLEEETTNVPYTTRNAEESNETDVMVEYFVEHLDGTKDDHPGEILEYFLRRDCIKQLKKLKELLESK